MGNPYSPKPSPPPLPPGPHVPPGNEVAPESTPAPNSNIDPEKSRIAIKTTLRFGVSMFAVLISTFLPLPGRMIAVVLAGISCTLGISALRRVRTAKIRGSIVIALSLGLALTTMLGISTLAVIPVWAVTMEYQQCSAQALTIAAKNECETDYRSALRTFSRR